MTCPLMLCHIKIEKSKGGEKMNESVTGIVLAGGRSTRFGQPKALELYKGKPFYQYSIDAISPFCSNIVIIAHPEIKEKIETSASNFVICDDKQYQGNGPLAGIWTGMQKKSAWYMVAPCDTPLLDSTIYKTLCSIVASNEELDAIIPVIKEIRQPLIGMYNRRCLPFIEQLLQQQIYKVGALLQRVSVLTVSEEAFLEDDAFMNINTKAQFERLLNKRNE